MTEFLLKNFNLWELLFMTASVFAMAGAWVGSRLERLNWQSDCLLERVRKGKYIDFVCSWKPKHAPNPQTTMEKLEQDLRNLRTAQAIVRNGNGISQEVH